MLASLNHMRAKPPSLHSCLPPQATKQPLLPPSCTPNQRMFTRVPHRSSTQGCIPTDQVSKPPNQHLPRALEQPSSLHSSMQNHAEPLHQTPTGQHPFSIQDRGQLNLKTRASHIATSTCQHRPPISNAFHSAFSHRPNMHPSLHSPHHLIQQPTKEDKRHTNQHMHPYSPFPSPLRAFTRASSLPPSSPKQAPKRANHSPFPLHTRASHASLPSSSHLHSLKQPETQATSSPPHAHQRAGKHSAAKLALANPNAKE